MLCLRDYAVLSLFLGLNIVSEFFSVSSDIPGTFYLKVFSIDASLFHVILLLDEKSRKNQIRNCRTVTGKVFQSASAENYTFIAFKSPLYYFSQVF